MIDYLAKTDIIRFMAYDYYLRKFRKLVIGEIKNKTVQRQTTIGDYFKPQPPTLNVSRTASASSASLTGLCDVIIDVDDVPVLSSTPILNVSDPLAGTSTTKDDISDVVVVPPSTTASPMIMENSHSSPAGLSTSPAISHLLGEKEDDPSAGASRMTSVTL